MTEKNILFLIHECENVGQASTLSFPFMFLICGLIRYLISRKIKILDAACSAVLWPLSGFVPVRMRGKIESVSSRGVFFALVEDP